MLIQATRTVRYAQKDYRAGETFEVTRREAKLLKGLKRAVDAPTPLATEPPAPAIETAPVVPMTTENSAPIAPVRRGRYARRDLRSEDSPGESPQNADATDEAE